MTVLVTAASRHGATRELAEALGRALGERGVETDVKRLEDAPDPSAYDAVVLGSAVYMGKWLEPARRFAADHAAELAARPTWLFSSGPIGDPPQPAAEKAVELGEIEDAVRPREHRLFAGKVDRERLGLRERAVLKLVHAEPGDYRDWDAVAAWAGEIADAL